MEPWGWLVGYVVLFAILHLVLYYVYVYRGEDGRTPTTSFAESNRTSARNSPGTDIYSGRDSNSSLEETDDTEYEPEIEGEPMHCPYCGTANESDPTFTYCWSCISPLRR